MALNSQSSHAVSLKGKTAEQADAGNWQSDLKAKNTTDEMRKLVLDQLENDKAEDIIVIELTGKSEVADVMIIASGRSQRHVGALAEKVSRQMKESGFGTPAVEGTPACDWVLIDAADVIVHLFRPEVRDFYDLERIWSPEAYADSPQPTNH